VRGAARPNCHILAMLHLAAGRGKAPSKPAAVRPTAFSTLEIDDKWILFTDKSGVFWLFVFGCAASAGPARHKFSSIKFRKLAKNVFGAFFLQKGM
jgi:hypothetical protein